MLRRRRYNNVDLENNWLMITIATGMIIAGGAFVYMLQPIVLLVYFAIIIILLVDN